MVGEIHDAGNKATHSACGFALTGDGRHRWRPYAAAVHGGQRATAENPTTWHVTHT